MKELLFLSEDKQFGLVLKQRHLRKIVALAQKAAPPEAGGVLVGTYTKDRRYAVVRSILCQKDRRGRARRTCFVREGSWLTNILARIWRKTRGTEYYLGEWHSHPGGAPQPSGRDKKEMRDIAYTPKEECSAPILVIIGGDFGELERHLMAFVFPRELQSREMKLLKTRGLSSTAVKAS